MRKLTYSFKIDYLDSESEEIIENDFQTELAALLKHYDAGIEARLLEWATYQDAEYELVSPEDDACEDDCIMYMEKIELDPRD